MVCTSVRIRVGASPSVPVRPSVRVTPERATDGLWCENEKLTMSLPGHAMHLLALPQAQLGGWQPLGTPTVSFNFHLHSSPDPPTQCMLWGAHALDTGSLLVL